MVTFVCHGLVKLNPDCRNVSCFNGLDHVCLDSISPARGLRAAGFISTLSCACNISGQLLSTDSAKQSTGIWNRSNTKTIERAGFDLFTHQRNLATFIVIFDLFSVENLVVRVD